MKIAQALKKLITAINTIEIAGGGAKFKTGTYVGNGVEPHDIDGVGFQPDGGDVWGKGGGAAIPYVTIATVESVAAGKCPLFEGAGSNNMTLKGAISAFIADGFTINYLDLNLDGMTYYYRMWKAG